MNCCVAARLSSRQKHTQLHGAMERQLKNSGKCADRQWYMLAAAHNLNDRLIGRYREYDR